MNSTIKKLIGIATEECGYLEKRTNAQLDDKTANAGSANYTKYARDVYPTVQGYAWCAVFVDWCAWKAGIPEDIIPKFTGATPERTWFRAKGLYQTQKSKYVPKAGDLILFSVDEGVTCSHIGIVTDCDGKTVYTIEGNTSGGSTLIANGGGVASKSYTLGYAKIDGYCTPAYPADPVVVPPPVPPPQPEPVDPATIKDPSDWAKDAWAWGTSNKITDGTMPRANCTREQVITMLYRYGKLIKQGV